MNDNIFLDKTFKAYKSSTIIPTLTKDQIDLILSSVSKIMFRSYRNQNNDIIPKYQNHDEILSNLDLIDQEKRYGPYIIRYIHLRHPDSTLLSRQTLIFVSDPATSKNYNTLVLSKISQSSGSNMLLSLIQQLDLDLQEPLIVKDYNAGHDFIKDTINELFEIVAHLPETYIEQFTGNVQLVYSQKSGSINSNLRHIVIDVPKSDISKFEHGDGPFHIIHLINDFLYQSSTINFDKLAITKFTSRIIQLSIDGKLKIAKDCVDDLDTILQTASNNSLTSPIPSHPSVKDRSSLVWFILGAIYNAF